MSVLIALGAWAASSAILHWVIGVSGGWAIALGIPVAALVVVLRLAPPSEDPVWAPLPAPEDPVGARHAVNLGNRLTDAHQDPIRFTTRLQPELARLADARLRATYAVELTDPQAVSILGPQLHTLVTDPAARLPGPQQTAALLRRLEEL